MTRTELEVLLERLLREAKRRGELGGYSTDAPVLKFIIDSLADLTLHVLQLDKQISRRKKK